MSTPDVIELIRAAAGAGEVRGSTAENIQRTLQDMGDDVAARAVAELVQGKQWAELDDRFYKTLAFGTGGLRGRTVGKVVTEAERGTPTETGRPQFPCVGTNAMNFANVRRATLGLTNYVKKWRSQHGGVGERPKIVIAHDTRHFSREFTQLAAQIASENGCDAVVFDGPRSTPELSFAVRYLHASAGVVITASHNPPQDNGFKAYFDDGAQVIEPHASGIIAEVNAVTGAAAPTVEAGEIITVGDEIDRAYMERLETLVIDRAAINEGRALKIVYTPIHGTGAILVKPILKRFGFQYSVVAAQDTLDGRFPTVKSPNPENAEALKLAVEQAQTEGADVVIATDPDCDRMGVAVRSKEGEMRLLTGNQTGALLAWYRATAFFVQGILNAENAKRAVMIKTFVTTDLQRAVAEKAGVRCIDTLTGFKYIGAKLLKYERALPADIVCRYREMSERETRAARLADSTFFVFGSEESYGYSGADFVRDKDGNAATIMFCEMAAAAKKRGLTIPELLDSIYAEYGYFEEKSESLVFEGADGAEKIRRLLQSYEDSPPGEINGIKVAEVENFEKDEIRDVEGDIIPKEKMLILTLSDATRIAVRGSGTEPKIKFYFFGQMRPAQGHATADDLKNFKETVGNNLAALWRSLRQDVDRRLEQ